MFHSTERSETTLLQSLPCGPALPPTWLAAAVLDATDSIVIVTDVHSGEVVALNKAAENVLGLDRTDVTGRPLWEICAPRDRSAVKKFFATSNFKALPRTYETTTVSESGAHFRIVWSSTFLTDPTGQRTHVVMTGVDVTDGHTTSGLFGQLMHAATTMVLIGTDQGGRITYCSSGAEHLLGSTRHHFLGRWLPAAAFGTGELSAQIAGTARPENSLNLAVDVSHHDHRADQFDVGPFDRHSDERRPGPDSPNEDWARPRDWLVTHGDGGQLIAEMSVTPVTDALGAGTGYLLTGVDVTEQRRSGNLLVSRLTKEAAAIERLRELDRIKDDLIATVSHELRTPLTSILAYAELLDDDEEAGALTPQQRQWTDAVTRNGDRLLTLVNDLLTVSTIESGKLRSSSTALDFRDVISAVRRALRPMIDGRQLRIDVELPSKPVIVRGDAEQLERAVCNLMSNAVKFTDDGGAVQCTLDADGSRALLTVTDNGIGIPEDEQSGVFTRFFRSSTATDRAIPGTGLGLSIVSSIVRSHGGEISVDSAPGRGTRVIVDLPLAFPTPLATDKQPTANLMTAVQ